MSDQITAILGVIILPLFIYILRKIDHMENIMVELLTVLKEVYKCEKER